ncbi:MurR/RpiR family transcriptional regulator [Chitinasiproducens palmae]|uniref:DNA-binding transcriptional regulator, MurR/RpiR family, contains HTH and SIS domains n=1 Tax=Chitinasiproducens palmae TaxID=1770053 RepID=A0A1H2PLL4_9BURK|nr:MurR/RpiR family transcriptional regulator [Chitinasiproducens palmae]SDV46567.1 DNA-binding transcriptional regulator, MurR/RpiR family, contains HTH and SIS domains [Chitinasiproducens palmae]
MDLVYRLRTRREQLSRTECKIADAVLDDVAFAASASIDQLAEKAGVSRSALTRFAQSLGCGDIRGLRMQLAQASAVGQRFLDTAPAVPETSAFFGQIVGDIGATLERHLRHFDEARFSTAAARLATARMTYAFGMGGCSTIFSSELQHRLVRLGRPVAAYHDPVLMRIAAATLGPDDALVLLSTTGVTPEMIEVARLARGYDARLVVVAPPASPLAALGDVVLPILLDETDFIYKPTAARYGMLLAIDLLATEVALQTAEGSRESLRRVKLALDDYRGEQHARLPLGD